MSRKGENIHKRKDGRWEARIKITFDGETKYKSIYGKTYREVKKKMLHFHEDIDSKKNLSEKTARSNVNRTFSEVAAEWFEANQMNQKASTQLKYHMMFDNHILPEFGEKPIEDVDGLMVNVFLSEKLSNGAMNNGSGLGTSYVRTMGILISSVLNYSVQMGYRNPLRSKISKPSEKKADIKVMDLADQKRLEEILSFDHSSTSIGIMIALNAGLRIGEICALKWEDISFNEKTIHVRHTVSRVKNNSDENTKTKLIIDVPKTKSSNRNIPINSKLYPLLLEAKNESISNYVVSDKESFLSPRTFEYRFHRLLTLYKIPDTNFHVLRHTFSTRCIEFGMDIKTLSEILGHANVGITLGTYVHSSFDLKRIQIEKLTALGTGV